MDLAPGGSGCICVDLLDIGGNGRPDFRALILWWSAFSACVLRLVAARSVAILGSCILSTTRRCVCVCVGVRGAPWGEAGQSLPVAALGQGMAVQDTCLGSKPNLAVASLTLCPIGPSHLFHVSLPSTRHYINLPLSLLSPQPCAWFHFFLHIPFCNLFICIRLSLFLPLSSCLSIFLCLSLSTSVFWQGCISSLAVLLGGRGWRGGLPGDVRVH